MIATAEYIEKPTYDAISMNAYFLWEKNGKPHGRDEEFWLNAERSQTCFPSKAQGHLESPIDKRI